MSQWSEMVNAINEAETRLRRADVLASDMVKMLKGRLRRVGDTWQEAQALDALKKELKNWNMKTHTWRD